MIGTTPSVSGVPGDTSNKSFEAHLVALHDESGDLPPFDSQKDHALCGDVPGDSTFQPEQKRATDMPSPSLDSTIVQVSLESVPSAAGLQVELRRSLLEALAAYEALAGSAAMDEVLRTHCSARATPPLQTAQLEKRVAELDGANNRLLRRQKEVELQIKQTVAMMTERLPALVSSVDPMRREILLPFLRTVAVLGTPSTARAAARHMMLMLYRRPQTEHRAAIVQEWLLAAKEAPTRSLEQELIPELYTLVNAQACERRLLGLECAAAVAPLLGHSPQVRYSLCQGLLRPLCEDESSAVRREIPRCLTLLWGDAGIDIESQPATPSSPNSFSSLSTSQRTFLMELLLHLVVDSSSRSVREAALTQLSEVLFPIFLRDGLLMSHFTPLVMTVIEMEARQLLLQGKLNLPAVDLTPGVGDGRAADVSGEVAPLRSTLVSLSFGNVVTLIQLLQAVFRCLKADVLHAQDGDPARSVGSAAALEATYQRVVLPTACSLISSLLSCSTHGSARETSLCLNGPLCALSVMVASLVPVFSGETWSHVKLYLISTTQPHEPPPTQTYAGVSSAISSEHPDDVGNSTSTTASHRSATLHLPPCAPGDMMKGRLLFLYAFLLCLCGDDGAPRDGSACQLLNQPDTAEHRSLSLCGEGAASPPKSDRTAASSAVTATVLDIQAESKSLLASSLMEDWERYGSARGLHLRVCAQCMACLAPLAAEGPEIASGIVALFRFLVTSADPLFRSCAISLMIESCTALSGYDGLKTHLFLEPVLLLLTDAIFSVQEAAVKGLLSVAVSLTDLRTQGIVIEPILRAADASGCTTALTRYVLLQWEQLMPLMPAEPREALLYPYLAVLMDQLAEQQVARLSCQSISSSPVTAETTFPTVVGKDAVLTCTSGLAAWEETMLGLQAVLHSIVKCAVVTPHFVSRYLMPGMNQLWSKELMHSCHASVQAHWSHLAKAYELFMDTNSGRLSSSPVPNPGNILNRVKDELKRRL